jgi:hypothetical protein
MGKHKISTMQIALSSNVGRYKRYKDSWKSLVRIKLNPVTYLIHQEPERLCWTGRSGEYTEWSQIESELRWKEFVFTCVLVDSNERVMAFCLMLSGRVRIVFRRHRAGN